MIRSTKVYGEPTSEGHTYCSDPLWVFIVLLGRQSQPWVTNARREQRGEFKADIAEASELLWGGQGKLVRGNNVSAET